MSIFKKSDNNESEKNSIKPIETTQKPKEELINNEYNEIEIEEEALKVKDEPSIIKDVIRSSTFEIPNCKQIVGFDKSNLDQMTTALLMKADKIYVINHFKILKNKINEAISKVNTVYSHISSIFVI